MSTRCVEWSKAWWCAGAAILAGGISPNFWWTSEGSPYQGSLWKFWIALNWVRPFWLEHTCHNRSTCTRTRWCRWFHCFWASCIPFNQLTKDLPCAPIVALRGFISSTKCLLPSFSTNGSSDCWLQGKNYVIEELTEDSFKGIDIALFSAGGSIR